MDTENFDKETFIALPRSVKAISTKRFKEMLAEELGEIADALPLESAMENGGWYKHNSIEVSVENFSDKGDAIEANVTVYFDEERQSGCADITYSDSHKADLTVVLDKRSGKAEVFCRGGQSTYEGDDYDADDFDARSDRDYRNSEF